MEPKGSVCLAVASALLGVLTGCGVGRLPVPTIAGVENGSGQGDFDEPGNTTALLPFMDVLEADGGEDSAGAPAPDGALDAGVVPDGAPDPWADDAPIQPEGLVWVPIPTATFLMGCSPGDTECEPDEVPVHAVTLSPYEILQSEVTEGQFAAVTGTDPSCDWGDGGGPDSPVECVSWNEARLFCLDVGGRLCTEAEWEYAARGGTTTIYYCGDDPGCLGVVAWFGKLGDDHKHDVMMRAPNAFGLYDMLGNVWEWTADWYRVDYYAGSPGTDPPGPPAGCGRVVRGGSWDSGWDDPGDDLRISLRSGSDPDLPYVDLGFRCCR